MSISAVIFDLDGTVLDNEDEYGEAFGKVLDSLGVDVDEEIPHTTGIGVAENWEALLDKYNIKTTKSINELVKQTQKEYLGLIDRVTLKEGFEEFVESLKESGLTVALATANEWWMVEKIMDHTNIEKYFDCTTTSEEVERNKPDPEIFIVTATKLNLSPGECLVFEDSMAGVKAAKLAGMRVVGVARDKNHAKKLKMADMVIEDYDEVTDLITERVGENFKNISS